MADGETGKCSFEVVRGFVERLGKDTPRVDQIREIAPALHDIYRRVMRVREVAPSIDLSERMWELMKMAGLKAKPVRLPFSRAALL